jgi:uncharacterized protein YciI
MADASASTSTSTATAAEQDKRLDQLEAGQSTILAKLEQLLGGGKPDEDGKPKPAGNIAEEIRQQLDARDARNKADADARAKEDRLAKVEEKISEKPPEPMPRRVEKFMGWH